MNWLTIGSSFKTLVPETVENQALTIHHNQTSLSERESTVKRITKKRRERNVDHGDHKKGKKRKRERSVKDRDVDADRKQSRKERKRLRSRSPSFSLDSSSCHSEDLTFGEMLLREDSSRKVKPLLDTKWVVDKTGDKDSLQYGGSYKGDVPAYKTVQRHNSHQFKPSIYETERTKELRYFSIESRIEARKASKKGLLPLCRHDEHTPRMSAIDVRGDFIPFQPLIENIAMYAHHTTDQAIINRTKDFNERLRFEPNNILLWLEYADFREMVASKSTHQNLYRNGISHISKIGATRKIDIFERAIQLNKDNFDLHLGRLNAAQDAGLEDRIIDKLYKNALIECSYHRYILLSCINFSAMRFSLYSLNTQRELISHLVQSISTTHNTENLPYNSAIVDLLHKLCLIDTSGGFSDRATGMMQAILELNIFSKDVVIEDFESFWDMEVPRIGDDEPHTTGFILWQRENVIKKPIESINPAPKKRKSQWSQRAPDFFAQEFEQALSSTIIRDDIAARSKASQYLETAYKSAMEAAELTKKREEDQLRSLMMESDAEDERTLGELIVGGFSDSDQSDNEPTGESDVLPLEVEKSVELQVDGKTLMRLNEQDNTVYSTHHGRRISLEGPANSTISSHEYKRILTQMRGADISEISQTTSLVTTSRKKIRDRRAEELAKEAKVLEHVASDDIYVIWQKREEHLMKSRWQPIRARERPSAAEAEPDRVVFFDDIRPFVFKVDQSLHTRLIEVCLAHLGLHFPRSSGSHSALRTGLSMHCEALGQYPISLLAGGLNLTEEGICCGFDKGVIGRLVVCTPLELICAQQELIFVDANLSSDFSKQKFLRNVLYSLVSNETPALISYDLRVQLQCCLVILEGALLQSWSQGESKIDDRNIERIRETAMSLVGGNQSTCYELRLYFAYFTLEEILGYPKEGLSGVRTILKNIDCHTDAKETAGNELFWLAFRMHIGLPLSCVGAKKYDDSCLQKLMKSLSNKDQNYALYILLCYAEKRYVQKHSSNSLEVTPIRITRAMHALNEMVSKSATELDEVVAELDATHSFFYHTMFLAWVIFLTDSIEASVSSIDDSIELIAMKMGNSTVQPHSSDKHLSNLPPYLWRIPPSESNVLAVTLERIVLCKCELLLLAGKLGIPTVPKLLRQSVIGGLSMFPASPALLCLFALGEEMARSTGRVPHYISQALSRHTPNFNTGTGLFPAEWLMWLGYELRSGGAEGVLSWSPVQRTRVRRAFEGILGHFAGRNLSLIWRLYISFELAGKCFTRAKQLYVRAVHVCPGSTVIWREAARLNGLRETFRSEELANFVDAMEEKDLRLITKPGEQFQDVVSM